MNRQGMQLRGLRWHLFGRAVAVRSRRTATISEALLCCRTCSASRGTVVHPPLAFALHYITVHTLHAYGSPAQAAHPASGVESSHAHHASVHNILRVEYVVASGGGRFQPRSAALQHVGPAAAMGKPGVQRHPEVPMATCRPAAHTPLTPSCTRLSQAFRKMLCLQGGRAGAHVFTVWWLCKAGGLAEDAALARRRAGAKLRVTLPGRCHARQQADAALREEGSAICVSCLCS